MLSPETLDLLRQWWKVRPNRVRYRRPVEERWLFPAAGGQADDDAPVEPPVPRGGGAAGSGRRSPCTRCATASRRICSSAAPTSASSRRCLGHAKLEATARYTRVATGMIASVESPLDLLSQPRKKRRDQEREETAGGVAARGMARTSAGGRGHLPRPRAPLGVRPIAATSASTS